jgi:hypothetical protein
MKEYIKKTLSEINTGDIKLYNSDYNYIEVETFNKDDFEKNDTSDGIRCFGFGSCNGGCIYFGAQKTDYELSLIDDEDAKIVRDAYTTFLNEEDKLWNDVQNTPCQPLYYISDKKLNIDLMYGNVLLFKDTEYKQKCFEFLELQPGDYGYTIQKSIEQEEQFYEWLTSKKDKKMRVAFRGQKIMVAPNFSQCQNGGNSLITPTLSAQERCLYKVDIDMYELSKKVEKINNDLYRTVRSVFEKYCEVKKERKDLDWYRHEIKAY